MVGSKLMRFCGEGFIFPEMSGLVRTVADKKLITGRHASR